MLSYNKNTQTQLTPPQKPQTPQKILTAKKILAPLQKKLTMPENLRCLRWLRCPLKTAMKTLARFYICL